MSQVQAESKTDIFIATPMFGNMCYGTYTDSLATAVQVFLNAQVSYAYSFRYNDALVTKARDGLAADFMQTDCSHLMFIDADIGFDARDILSMVDADKDIICGVYPQKKIDWEQVSQAVQSEVPSQELHKYAGTFPVNTLDGTSIIKAINSSGQQPLEVRNAGTGFMLIKREVLENLADKVPQYPSGVDGDYRQYFDTSISSDDNTLLSEDYYFCKLARHNGFKVWVAPWVSLSHTGTYTFTGRP